MTFIFFCKTIKVLFTFLRVLLFFGCLILFTFFYVALFFWVSRQKYGRLKYALAFGMSRPCGDTLIIIISCNIRTHLLVKLQDLRLRKIRYV